MSKSNKPHDQKHNPAPKPKAPEPKAPEPLDTLAGNPYYQKRAQALYERAPPRDSEQGVAEEATVGALQRFWRWFCVWRLAPPRK
jgi:hypothetical protein